MKYQKPQVIAKNNPTGSYAAGCPTNSPHNNSQICPRCLACEIGQ